MKSSKTVFKRCKPLLGTFVEISLYCSDFEEFLHHSSVAFQAVSQVHELMNFHSEESDLSKLNMAPVGEWIEIDPRTAEVLECASMLHSATHGAFDIASRSKRALAEPGFDLSGKQARRTEAVQLDLSGIAKGYAVDQAAKALLQLDPTLNGCINAGGDLRVLGDVSQTTLIRRSRTNAEESSVKCEVKDEALATSTVAVREGESHYWNPESKASLARKKTAVARSKSCMLADAFTKIALLLPQEKLKPLEETFAVRCEVIS